MKYFILLIIFLTNPVSAKVVKDNNCKSAQSSTAIAMMDAMYHAMRIDTDTIISAKTKTELQENEPLSKILLSQYATEDYKKDADNWLSVQKYKEIYSADSPRNLIIKFTFVNKDDKENIFLVSAIANNYECNVRFNGYIIVKREF
jgi:hypothetical protein